MSRSHCVLVGCGDPRIPAFLLPWMTQMGWLGHYDTEMKPGGPLALANEDVSTLIDIADYVGLHNPDTFILYGHSDCGKVGKSDTFASPEAERQRHLDILAKAKQVLQSRFPQVAIYRLFYLIVTPGDDGRVTGVEEVFDSVA